eukprot:gb/GEZN01004433.1/.p1 GENE.gb/GEZN01004433.1/~~gb/GEZN01004433.1/.p1  ORF type:complete len:160 (-),score=18.73 gb/GEZN01004433.1/:1178-1657(-)
MLLLHDIYCYGLLGASKREDEGRRWCDKAAKLGHPPACLQAAFYIFDNTQTKSERWEMMLAFLECAAEQGYVGPHSLFIGRHMLGKGLTMKRCPNLLKAMDTRNRALEEKEKEKDKVSLVKCENPACSVRGTAEVLRVCHCGTAHYCSTKCKKKTLVGA